MVKQQCHISDRGQHFQQSTKLTRTVSLFYHLVLFIEKYVPYLKIYVIGNVFFLQSTLLTNVPSELYRYVIDTELQLSGSSIFGVAHFVFFRA